MDQATFTDLKQFISETINRQTLDIYQGMADMRRSIMHIEGTVSVMQQDIKRLDEKTDSLDLRTAALDRKIDKLECKVDQKFDELNAKIDQKTDDLDRKLDAVTHAMSEAVTDIHGDIADHERRLTRLERHPI